MYLLKVLGGALLEGPGGPVSGRPAQKRRIALLTVLAVARRPVGRERLIGYLWPDHASEKARHLLSESLYILRKEMGEDALLSAGNDVTLNARVVACDAARFDAHLDAGELEAAAHLYRRPFLDGFYVDDAPEFQRWADEERDRLAHAFARAVETLAEGAEAAGRAVEAVEYWRRLTVHDPYSTRVAIRFMRALAVAGDHAAALRFADAHDQFVREETGRGPGGDFVVVYREIFEACPAEPLPPTAPPPSVDPRPSIDPPPYADPLPASAHPAPDGTAVETAGEPSVAVDPGPPSPDPGKVAVFVIADPDRAGPDAAPRGARDDDGGADPGAETLSAGLPRPAAREPVATPPARGGADGRARRREGWVRDLAYYGGLVGMVIGLMLSAVVIGRPQPAPPPPDYDPRRIAVLYFDDNTPRRDMEHLADGLTEGLIKRLGEVDALTVISRNGVARYRGGVAPFDSMVQALDVGSVVEGSLQRSGDRLRVTVRLIDGNTAAELESRTLESPMGELFALEDRLADSVASFLRRRVGAEVRLRAWAAGTKSVEARQLVFRAEQERRHADRMAALVSPLGADAALRHLASADSLLERAAATDPKWAEPWVLRGWVRLRSARLDSAGAGAALEEGIRHAEHALKLQAGHAGALELRGTARWRAARLGPRPRPGADTLVEAAGRDLRAAVQADPSAAGAWSTLSQYLRMRNFLVEADQAVRRALEEDAYLEDAEMIIERLYRANFTLARHDSAAAWCERGARRFPSSWRFLDCRLTLLGAGSVAAPDVGRAWKLVEEADQVDPPARARAAGRGYFPLYRRMVVARVLARAGLADSARAVMARVAAEAGGDTALVSPMLYDQAVVHVLLGEPGAAVDALELYVRTRPDMPDYLAGDFQLRALRGDRRFRALVTERPAEGSASR